jgi:hypothetical protein
MDTRRAPAPAALSAAVTRSRQTRAARKSCPFRDNHNFLAALDRTRLDGTPAEAVMPPTAPPSSGHGERHPRARDGRGAKANQHPGMPMGMAEIAVALWGRHLRHSPQSEVADATASCCRTVTARCCSTRCST